MKKIYTKPDIMFEDFSLNTSIAGGCEVKVTTAHENSCPFIWNAGIEKQNVFTDVLSVCTTKVTDDGNWNGLCYHVPIESNNLFNS